MKPFRSPSYLQLEGLSSYGKFLAVSSSSLGGNEWHGELRLFTRGSDDEESDQPFQTVGAVRLDYGSSCCKIFNNGTAVACGTDAGEVLVFQIGQDGQLGTAPSLRLAEHDDVVVGIDVMDGQLASASWDRTVKIWDLQSGKLKETIDLSFHSVAVQFLDANMIATAERDGSVSVWDARKGMVARRVMDHSVCSLASSKGQFLIVGLADGSIVEWTPGTNTVQQLRRHNAAVHALAICPDTERLLSGSDDGRVFSVEGHAHEDFVRGAAWWQGRPVTSSWDGTLRFVDVDVVV